jgi:hypothetical protein
MINSERNIEPREGVQPVRVRQGRLEGRGRTDAQMRVKRSLAKKWGGCQLGPQTLHTGRSEVMTK